MKQVLIVPSGPGYVYPSIYRDKCIVYFFFSFFFFLSLFFSVSHSDGIVDIVFVLPSCSRTHRGALFEQGGDCPAGRAQPLMEDFMAYTATAFNVVLPVMEPTRVVFIQQYPHRLHPRQQVPDKAPGQIENMVCDSCVVAVVVVVVVSLL